LDMLSVYAAGDFAKAASTAAEPDAGSR